MTTPNGVPTGLITEQEYIKKYEPLVEAWDKQGFIENDSVWGKKHTLKSDYMKAVVAVCLDNVRKTILPNSSGIEDALETSKRAVEMFGGLAEATTPTTTTAMSGATNLPLVLGYVRKIMPKMFTLDLVATQPMSLPTGRVFTLNRIRHNNGTDGSNVEARAGWSFRSFDDTPGEATAITKSVRFTLTSADVSTTAHKLQAETGIEIEQDLRAYHGIDAAQLVSDAATDEIAMELDERILHQLWAQANGGTFSIGVMPSGWTQTEWDKRYLEVLTRAAEHMWTNRRVDPRHVVLGSAWTVQFANTNLNAYNRGDMPTDPTFNMGNGAMGRIGNIQNFLAYKASLPFPTTDGLLIHKGDSWVDAAFFYLPYVPLQVYSIWRDPNTQVQRISWISRYATNFNDAKRVATLKIDTTLTGTSYPAFAEYDAT